MITRKIKKTVLSITLATSLAMPSMVSATYPTIDFSNLLEAITQNYQDMQNWAQERMMMMAEMDLQSALSSLGIDAENNAMTNMMVREGRRAQTIQRLEVMEWSMADSDACSTITSQVVTKEVNKRADNEKENNDKESKDKHNNFADNAEDWKDKVTKEVESVFETCEALVDTKGATGIASSLCTEGGNIISAGTKGRLTKEQSKASQESIKILVGVAPTFKDSSRLPNGKAKKKMILNEVRLEAFRDMARKSLDEVNSQFRLAPSADGGLASPFEALKKFDDKRYGNPTWMSCVQNAGADCKNSIYISQINRKIAVMNAFLVHMEIIKYRQQLRIEGLNAAMLSLKVEPL